MMERMLRYQFQLHGITDVEVESAGLLESAAGQPMAEFSAKELESRGISADGHVARYVGALNLIEFDYVLTVGRDEMDDLLRLCKHRVNIGILGRGGVPNTWLQGEEAYRECAELIEEELKTVVKMFQ
jgi:protein-tyrosine-phosphatase